MKSLFKMGKEFNRYSGANPELRAGLQRVAEELSEANLAVTNYEQAKEQLQLSVFEVANFRMQIGFELTDIILTIASIAANYDIHLDAFLSEKHRINMKRTWRPHPIIKGAVQHVKGEET